MAAMGRQRPLAILSVQRLLSGAKRSLVSIRSDRRCLNLATKGVVFEIYRGLTDNIDETWLVMVHGN